MKIARSSEEVVHQNTKLVAIQVAIACWLLCDYQSRMRMAPRPPSMNALAGVGTCPGLKSIAVLYWQLIGPVSGAEAASLRLHLLQRIEQHLRLRWAEVTSGSITIFDNTGRPGRGPRPHQIPLLNGAVQALAEFRREAEFVISTTGGKKAISCRTLAGWAHDIVGTSIDGLQLKRIRSGVETLLAAKWYQP